MYNANHLEGSIYTEISYKGIYTIQRLVWRVSTYTVSRSRPASGALSIVSKATERNYLRSFIAALDHLVLAHHALVVLPLCCPDTTVHIRSGGTCLGSLLGLSGGRKLGLLVLLVCALLMALFCRLVLYARALLLHPLGNGLDADHRQPARAKRDI